ncbi:MAG: 2-amino-4-hydroxy-6-hydroxymethyldihydropteridine diphosphokinase [Candidatus Aminicenantes bacterium]|nr:2-amino-4-hydroxy-6-hydroxymethyldihydropteridine diphosphokinase [Candidatus Aminicenantes bacterium]
MGIQRRFWLGLGSNEGDPPANLRDVLRRLRAEGIRVIRRSPVFRTEPVGNKDQPWFLNQAVEIRTVLGPSDLLRTAKKIENAMGRRTGPRNGPRPIDLDILFGEGPSLRTAALVIPHPRLAERRFALISLAAIAPKLVHPELHKTIRQLLQECPDASRVERLRVSASRRKDPGRGSPRAIEARLGRRTGPNRKREPNCLPAGPKSGRG